MRRVHHMPPTSLLAISPVASLPIGSVVVCPDGIVGELTSNLLNGRVTVIHADLSNGRGPWQFFATQLTLASSTERADYWWRVESQLRVDRAPVQAMRIVRRLYDAARAELA
jgi:hypothetical protein